MMRLGARHSIATTWTTAITNRATNTLGGWISRAMRSWRPLVMSWESRPLRNPGWSIGCPVTSSRASGPWIEDHLRRGRRRGHASRKGLRDISSETARGRAAKAGLTVAATEAFAVVVSAVALSAAFALL